MCTHLFLVFCPKKLHPTANCISIHCYISNGSQLCSVCHKSKQYSQDLQKCTESSQCQIEQLPSMTTAKACNEIGKENLTSLTWPWLTITTISGHQSFCKLS